MSDLICRKTMQRCNTPGMCMPHGGCRVSVLADCRVSYSNSTDSVTPMIIDKVKERLALIARMRVGGESLDPVFSERDVRSLVGVIDQLKAENEAMRKDVERYRWLRDPDNQCAVEDDSDYYMPPMICGYAEHEDILTHEALDKAIDSAMIKEK